MHNASLLAVDCIIIVVFFAAIAQFRSPLSARNGNLTAAFALICAALVVLLDNRFDAVTLVVLALAVGSVGGWIVSARVNMLQIPAMVGFQNGAGGMAAFLVSFIELVRKSGAAGAGSEQATGVGLEQVAGILGIVVGAATFSGSMLASAKLAGWVHQRPTHLPKHNLIVAIMVLGIGVLAVLACMPGGGSLGWVLLGLSLLSLVLGVVFAVRIGGADMPVLISFLNAGSGLAAAFCGMVIENRLLIACGATVGASGLILTYAMCRAMNRSLLNVLVAADMKGPSPQDEAAAGWPEPTTADGESSAAASEEPPLARAADALKSAESIIIIPGYGMALAHAQFEVVRLAETLSKQGKKVRYAIHPIAGRMPGHMHVLLAEAEADPDMLFDLPEINDQFKDTDVVVVVGACDVVNPAAIDVEGTPISGMPILLAHDAKHVVVCNLDQNPGYSGVQNPLYRNPKTIGMFGDAKAGLTELLAALA
ncbi:MAG: NAD(P)(+) transhydrogenase (Re/Si-specific) subunit beta [Pirellulaceae bacterium]|nr:NAD(P)(+) transhydrogenase (Re/Si-specific) subunit beta [Pirellulaceae bacterium]